MDTTTTNPTAERQPLHWLTQTRTYGDGLAYRHVTADRFATPEAAQDNRVRRLRTAGIPFTEGAGWVEYREAPPAHLEACTVRLEWSAVEPGDGGTFGPEHLARGMKPRPGQRVRVECDDTTGARVVADMVADTVALLGCGCWRLAGDRPGPRVPGGCHGLHVLTGCGMHRSELLPVESGTAAEPVAEVTEPPAEPAGYMLVRITPNGRTREQGPVRRVRDAAALAAQVLTDNTRTSRADAQRFAALLDGTPTGQAVAHEPTGYRFRVEVGRRSAPEVAPEVVAEPEPVAAGVHGGWGSVRGGRWHRTVSPKPTFTQDEQALCGITFRPLNVEWDGLGERTQQLYGCKRCEGAAQRASAAEPAEPVAGVFADLLAARR